MNKISILVGHTGSGKSEIAINLAIKSSSNSRKVILIDLDIVNPYLCLRDFTVKLKDTYNIEVISSLADYRNAELMVLSKDILAALMRENTYIIIDVGGDGEGAKVLKQYSNIIKKYTYEVSFVINTLRADTRKLDEILGYINTIEKSSSLSISNLICNTNILNETTIEDIICGQKLVRDISKILNIPIVNTVIDRKYEQSKNLIDGNVLIIDRFIKSP